MSEPNETFTVNLSNATNATIADNQGIGTIIDNDGMPNITINDKTVNEGAGSMSFTVTLSASTASAVSVYYQTSSGTAIAPGDYTSKSSTLTIPAGSTSGTINITIIDDTMSEPNETFTVNLSNATNATIADNQGIGTIVDNDGMPNITISDETANENIGTMSFTVTLSVTSASAVSVFYQTSNGTAVAPGDYISKSGVLTIRAGNIGSTINVSIIDDALMELNETFYVNLSNASNATIADNQGVGTIIDNEGSSNITISDGTANENAGVMSFSVILSATANADVIIDYQTINGTATTPDDYTATHGTLTIPVGSTIGNINVPIIDDNKMESDEIFYVILTNAVNAMLADNLAKGTIIDNDSVPNISISDESANESVGTMNFTVTLATAINSDVMVSYQTTNGTAISSQDYLTTTGTLTIAAGNTIGNINVPIIDDGVLESNETFYVNLSNPANANIADNQAVATIIDNDGTPNISISDETANENVGNMHFTVTLSFASASVVSVFYQTMYGTADAPYDYTPRSGTLTFPLGSTSETIIVPIIDDAIVEINENFYVSLSNPVNATIAINQAVGKIIDNDGGTTISISDVTGNENVGNLRFAVNLTVACASAVTVDYRTINGTATAPGDFTNTSGTLTIPANYPNGTINVPVKDDVQPEANETFYIELSDPCNATITRYQAEATIVDNDGVPSITIENESVNENAGYINFTLGLSSPSTSNVTVYYKTSDGSAQAPGDYTTKSGTLTLPATTLTGTISIPIFDDTISEPTENFYIDLSNATNAILANNQAKATILDDDGAPSLTIGDENENENVGAMSFTVSLSAASPLPVSINYQTINGSAIAPADYETKSGTVTIAVGSTTNTITIPINDDALGENDENFYINLSNPTNAKLADVQATGIIIDNDTPSVSISDETENEDVGTMNFFVTLSNPSVLPVRLDYQTNNGSAMAPIDYVSTASTLNIPPDSITATINVLIIDDYISEALETLTIDLSNPVNAIIEDGQGEGTIIDNDVTEVFQTEASIPLFFKLYQNYPNPFNPETTIEFGLPKPGFVEITIYDVRGKLVRTLVSEQKRAGQHWIKWDVRGDRGMRVSSGVYIYHMKSGYFHKTQKMIFAK